MSLVLDTLAFQILPTGFSAPSPTDVLESLKASFRSIYGADALVEADTQDGQWLAIYAQGISDVNAAAQTLYNAFQPDGAVGTGLSANVKINGLERQPSTHSQSDLTLTGTPGTVITNGKVRDTVLGNLWDLPASVTIPAGSTIIATATCEAAGAILAAPNTISIIATPTGGWSTANNPVDAVAGTVEEDDAQLRFRQTKSVALPGQSRLAAMVGAVLDVHAVVEVTPYENTTNAIDSNGLPAHSIGLVISGGDAVAVATALMNSKTPGAFMYGSTVQTLVDAYGVTQTMRWTVPSAVNCRVNITLKALTGYTTDIGTKIKNRLSQWVLALPAGQSVFWSRLFAPALLLVDPDGNPISPADPDAATYDITILQQDTLAGGGYSENNIAVGFGQAAHLAVGDVHITVI